MDFAELLLGAVAAAIFGIGFIFGRGNDAAEVELRDELADKDQELDETRQLHQADIDRLNQTADDLQATMQERDERDAFIGHMRNSRAFEAWSSGSTNGAEAVSAGHADVLDWLTSTSGLGLIEGKDFLVQPEFPGAKRPDFVRIHHDFAWVIEARNLDGSSMLADRLRAIAEDETGYLASQIKGRTNLGHMVVVTNPAATDKGILPPGYEQYESLFFAVHDYQGFYAADYAMRTLAARLSSVDKQIDPHHIELQANEVIRQGQSQIRAGQKLVMLGESIRQNLTGAIPFGLVGQDTYDDILFQPVDGTTTVRMKPLPGFNPMVSNPAPLQTEDPDEVPPLERRNLGLVADLEPSTPVADELDLTSSGSGVEVTPPKPDLELIDSYDPDAALLDRLDAQERDAFDLADMATAGIVQGMDTDHGDDPDPLGPGRDDPPLWV